MILLQIYFEIAPENQRKFEQLYTEIYVPALQVQTGYMRSTLLHVYPQHIAQEIGALTTAFNYQIELVFDTEMNRRLWVASREHASAWGQAEALAVRVAHCGYDVIDRDENPKLEGE